MAVLLLSVDASYGFPGHEEKNKTLLAAHGLAWPNVLVPGGWTELEKTLNVSGYGLVLVDQDGLVRGVDLRKSELIELVGDLYAKKLSAEAKRKDRAAR